MHGTDRTDPLTPTSGNCNLDFMRFNYDVENVNSCEMCILVGQELKSVCGILISINDQRESIE